MGETVALVSQKPKIPSGKVILYGELFYMYREIVPELESFMYLMDEIVTRKNL